MRPAPTAGISDSTAITTPHNKAPGIPSHQKINPPSAPWVAATSRLPLMVARVTSANLANSSFSRSSPSGSARISMLTMASPSRIRKNARYSISPRLRKNWKVFWPTARARLARNWPAPVKASTVCDLMRSRSISKRSARVCNQGKACLMRST